MIDLESREHDEAITVIVLESDSKKYLNLSPAAKLIYRLLIQAAGLDNIPGTVPDLAAGISTAHGFRAEAVMKAIRELKNKNIVQHRIIFDPGDDYRATKTFE